MEEHTEEREEGVTFGEILSAIKRRIWVILLLAVALTVAMVLAVEYGYNSRQRTYSLTFGIVYPGSDTFKYPDGTPFFYQDIISSANLEAAKASGEDFASIRVEKISEKNAIAIEAQTLTVEGQPQQTGWYTVSVKGNYFEDKEQATAFLKALAAVPLRAAQKMASEVNYHLDEEVFRGADFNERIALLAQQKRSLLAQYDEWIALYRESYPVGGMTLRNHRAGVVVLFTEATQEALQTELDENGYTAGGASSAAADFESRLEEQYTALDGAASTVRTVSEALFAQTARTSFATETAERSGGLDPIITAIGGLVIWFIGASVVVCCVEIPKRRALARKERTPEEQ